MDVLAAPVQPTLVMAIAESPERLRAIGMLFREYASALGGETRIADLVEELRGLPGPYAGPRGALLLAEEAGRPAGCVAVRELDVETCEMRRMFVRHPFRGRGFGRTLASAAIQHARVAGFTTIRLHLAPWMTEAVALYRTLGFTEIAQYREVLLGNAVFMELRLV